MTAPRQTDKSMSWTLEEMEKRVVRYADLRPCTTAFIDTRTPGSDRKENFTIIGPGVAENPDQHVHIPEPHGFNIGAARQPPHCTNSQHSHETAEVFVVYSGTWKFVAGVDKTDAWVVLQPGDVISIPTRVFRGFENVGKDTGFIYAVLGGDDPGRVTWAPDVLEKARAHGLILLENGALVDTLKGGTVPEGARPVTPLAPEAVSQFLRVDNASLARCIVRRPALTPNPDSPLAGPGIAECPVIGVANPAENMPAGPLGWAHGFQVRRIDMAPGAAIPDHRRLEEEVLFVCEGQVMLCWDGMQITLNPGDTLTVPKGLRRRFVNSGHLPAEVFVTRGGDHPAAPIFD